jgi:Fanconi anemia group M protein
MQGKVSIIVDQRERNRELLEALNANGVDVSMDTIPVGDYIVSDRICIERKTISDFEGSIMSGRLFDQVSRLNEAYQFPIVILEGSMDEIRLERKVIVGAIIALYLGHYTLTIMSEGPGDTAEIITRIAKQEQGEKSRAASVKGGARAFTHEQFQERVIGNVPSVGPKLANALLKRFGSVRRIANASVEELMEVEKIGEKKAVLIHKTLNQEYNHASKG